MTDRIKDFIPLWLQHHLDSLGAEERKQFLSIYEEAVQQALVRLQDVSVNKHSDGTEEGHFSLRLGSKEYFVNVKKAVWTAAKYAGPLIMAAAISPALLAHFGLTAAMMPHISLGTAGSAVTALYGAFSKLSPSELDTYEAVAAAIERNKNQVLANSGADFRDVQESFRRHRNLFPPTDLHPMLEQLVSKLVLEKKVVGGIEQYFLAF